ncbi:MAG: periplasmic heavy metal sensor [Desulfobacteraceae bacterium]|nr:MAG: periplasmic heavy metal sensor [Desulfobacteraceae bacterium]
MKKIVAIGGIIFLVAVIATYVLAHGPGRWGVSHMMSDWGCNPRYYSQDEKLTDEQSSQMDELYRKFHDETVKLRNNIWTKSAELDVLLNSSETNAEKARVLQKEISELKVKLAQERISYDLEARKIAPKGNYGRRYAGWGGHHMEGYGHHMRGHRPDMCWK